MLNYVSGAARTALRRVAVTTAKRRPSPQLPQQPVAMALRDKAAKHMQSGMT
jgi:hypothetical protein